ncbi:MAG: NAD/NADP octopine/nopaline dehydrogenase family protein [Chloroflexota bacterium]
MRPVIKRITVIGAGHGGKAMAAHLSLMGAKVTMYNRTWKHIEAIADRGGVLVKSNEDVNGFGELAKVTSDIEEAVKGSQLIMLVVPAFAHAELARKMSEFLKPGQIIVLNPGRTLGALEFRKVLIENNCSANVIVAEAQTFLYASRSSGPAEAFIHRIKEAVPLAAFPAKDTQQVLDVLRPYFPQFINGKTVLHTGLNNIGAIFHPTILMYNLGRLEATGGDFQFYVDGVTPSVAKLMEAVDRERVRIGRMLGIETITAKEWLKLAYNADGDNLYESIHNQEGYRGIKAPSTVNHRYINEDIPMSLVPMASLGDMFGIRVRGMASIIRQACIIRDKDVWAIGRSVESLGLSHLRAKNLLSLVADGNLEERNINGSEWLQAFAI